MFAGSFYYIMGNGVKLKPGDPGSYDYTCNTACQHAYNDINVLIVESLVHVTVYNYNIASLLLHTIASCSYQIL